MNRNQFTLLSGFKFLAWVVSIALSIAIFFHPVQGQTVMFEPRNKGTVDDSRGGASRSAVAQCQSDAMGQPELTPVVPPSHLGLTLSANPTFYIYIPPTSAPEVQLTLKDKSDRGVYQTTIPLDQVSGILAVPLPNFISLDLDQTYGWFAGLVCQPVQTDFPWVQGYIQRVSPDRFSTLNLEQKTLLEQAEIYGRQGLWYDTLNSLAQYLQTQPHDEIARQNWVNLLNSVGLESIADQPLIRE